MPYYGQEKRNYDNNRIKQFRDRLWEIKSVPCMDCGGTFPPYVMDFDHRDPSQKELSLSRAPYLSWDKVLTEIEKCDIVCSNCHRIRTHMPDSSTG